jgi:hypothetical protein
MRKRGRVAATVAVGALAVSGLAPADRVGDSPPITDRAQHALLRLAGKQARTNGDRHPFDIEAVRLTYRRARLILGGSRSDHVPWGEPMYVVAMRGRFNPQAGFISNRVAFRLDPHPPVQVLEMMFTASPLQEYESDQFPGPYPKLSHVVHLG